jgi:hypothetical protein
VVALLGASAPAIAQGTKAAGPKMVMNDVTIKMADATYTGTMTLGIARGQATGKLHLTAPAEVLGDVAGTSAAGVVSLDFPYRMPERNCEGRVKMTLTIPPKPGPVTGTMEAVGCGRDAGNKAQGTVELVPQAPKPKK